MSTLLNKFCSFLPSDRSDSYTTYRLKLKLKQYFGDSKVFQAQHGQSMSNIVYSSSVSLSDAIKAANRLKSEEKTTKASNLSNEKTDVDEDQVLHAAASILRKKINDMVIPVDEYPISAEASLSFSSQMLPSALTKFMLWLLDDSAYDNV